MPKTIWHTKKRILTEAEMRTRKDAVVEHMQKINEIEAEKKIEVKKFAEKLKPHKFLVDNLMAQITTGVDEGSASCEVQVDTVTQTVRFIKVDRKYNNETSEYEYSRELFDEKTFDEVGEKQLSMWQGLEVNDSVERIWDVLTDNEQDALRELEDSSQADEEIAWDEAIQGLLTPMTPSAAATFLARTGKPDSVLIQTLKNVGLRDALELILECYNSLHEDDLDDFISGVFADPTVGLWLLEKTESIPHRQSNEDEDDLDSDDGKEAEVLTAPAGDGDE